ALLPPVAALPLADRVASTPAGLSVHLKRPDPPQGHPDPQGHPSAHARRQGDGGRHLLPAALPTVGHRSTRQENLQISEAEQHPGRGGPGAPPRAALRQHPVQDCVRLPGAARAGLRVPDIIPSVTRRPTSCVESNFLVQTPGGGALIQVELVEAAEGEEFMVRVLDECGEMWEEEDDIGNVAVPMDTSDTVAMSMMECPGLRPNTIYYRDLNSGETRV
uniref:KIB1-4 beta-propeller domain-containing protein n=1 Tax=Triticum urartu TaxID=4572 RepID=A0A8R7VCF5_TRIUA